MDCRTSWRFPKIGIAGTSSTSEEDLLMENENKTFFSCLLTYDSEKVYALPTALPKSNGFFSYY
jgi:hypothetical protein